MRREWEEAHTVTEELVEGPPSRRANATLTTCPVGNHLWCIGGEFFSEDGRAHFYNDVFRYTPEKDEWRKFVSPTCPGPRSAHAVVASPAGGGKLFLFGGEYSSLHQNTFHHYRDFWVFDIQTHSWDRIDTKVRPSARSGHRMALWKGFVVLFGGFYDPGVTTRYLNDLWVFDMQEYKWSQVEFKETELKPSFVSPTPITFTCDSLLSARSGFSFLPCTDGIILHGGYCKEYYKGKRPVGRMLEDTWLLKITTPEPPTSSSTTAPTKSKPSSSSQHNHGLSFKWERRKRASDAYAPSIRSGCTMALWPTRGMGILFGGVTDEDKDEETLDSVFWNDLYGYQLSGKGRWTSLALKAPKSKGSAKAKKKKQKEKNWSDNEGSGDDAGLVAEDSEVADKTPITPLQSAPSKSNNHETSANEDPNLTLPIPRYNTMLTVLRNTLYIYGGIYERGSREYTLDDFYSIQLDKLDKCTCLKESAVIVPDVGEESSSSDDDDDEDNESGGDDDSDDEGGEGTLVGDEIEEGGIKKAIAVPVLEVANEEGAEGGHEEGFEEIQDEEDDLRKQASAFMGVSKDTTRSAEDVISTPLPGETLAMFYARSREHWTSKVFGTSDNRGKELRRDGFALAEERYAEYKPILEKVEKILAEAGLDEDEMRRSAVTGTGGNFAEQSRNRR
ncbi:uncharacterized protein LACBIDRAFT_310787 [Laccaria bicolor S238N-H82]|uniref:Predicted protein n=1 Tax=Laccaria bicolor (strain S238N-H82 / ATCC MYA-4686) TaxID=486041 RepID=B0DV32_LACBS|nr:uncharacterized protein LACBIDRAFT_310787 [Laccaria bicolor S238N-H82]EDR01442.1 predicted protein [Laccaria bicolor S238N-H82]|eukprot:XP_001887794.1 predicted protein [Laccaria bicolor S238N-H82]